VAAVKAIGAGTPLGPVAAPRPELGPRAAYVAGCADAVRSAQDLKVGAFIGHLQLRLSSPALLRRSVGPLERYVDDVIDTLLAH
jgi:hypothetical protein